jgi:hypothetical protein
MPPNLKTHIENFRHWLKTDPGDAATWQKERRARLAWYHKSLARDKVKKLSRDDFATLIKSLWATNIWKNKDYKAGRVIDDTGLDKLGISLEALLYGADPIEKRWDEFGAAAKGLGPSSVSEILAFFDPQQYAIVNLKPYRVLPRLDLPIKPVRDGKSYKRAVEQIGKVKAQLEDSGVKDADFILTDFFIAYLFYHVFDLQYKREGEIPKPPPKGREEKPPAEPELPKRLSIDSHEAAEAVLLMLGNLLGYDTYTPDAGRTYKEQKLGDIATLQELPDFTSPKIMDSVQNIDVVWLKEEWPEYFFEVEHSTGVTSGLLRIYQAEKIPAQFFIVAPQKELRRFQREVEKAPFNRIKKKYQFRSYEELHDMYLATASFRKTSDHFLG